MSGGAKFLLFSLVAGGFVLAVLWTMGKSPPSTIQDVTINAPPEQVFEWLVQPELRIQWTDSLKGAEIAMSEEDALPSGYRSTYEKDGETTVIEERITQFNPPDFLSIKSTIGGMGIARIFRLKELNDKSILTFEIVRRPGGLARLMFAFIDVDPAPVARKELQNLKRLVENSDTRPLVFGQRMKSIEPESATETTQDN